MLVHCMKSWVISFENYYVPFIKRLCWPVKKHNSEKIKMCHSWGFTPKSLLVSKHINYAVIASGRIKLMTPTEVDGCAATKPLQLCHKTCTLCR